MSNKSRNTTTADAGAEQAPRPDDLAALGIEPMSARSVILSALLGTHPPTLATRSLVALAELFGIRAGTVRTSLSRMVANGELVAEDGHYGLAGRLLERQREQDTGRTVTDGAWSGEWITAIAAADRRSMAERRAFRESMIGARLAELRPDIWMRPANTPAPPPSPDVIVTIGRLDCDDVGDLVGRLWPLEHLEATAQRLAAALERQHAVLDSGDLAALPQTFMVSAAAVRFLRTEPQLPDALVPAMWTASELRDLYDDLNHRFLVQLREFFSSAG